MYACVRAAPNSIQWLLAVFDVCCWYSQFWPQGSIPLCIATLSLSLVIWRDSGQKKRKKIRPPIAQGNHNRAGQARRVMLVVVGGWWVSLYYIACRQDSGSRPFFFFFLVYSRPRCWVTFSHHTAALPGCFLRVIRHKSTPSYIILHAIYYYIITALWCGRPGCKCHQ